MLVKTRIRFYRLSLFVALLVCIPSLSQALDTPQLQLVVDNSGQNSALEFFVESEQAFSGFNIYRDGDYLSTRRSVRSREQAVAGSYCVVTFDDQPASADTSTQYSVCSASITVTADELIIDTSDRQSEIASLSDVLPTGLRAEIYSPTDLELFWDRVTGDPNVVGFRVFRDDRLLGETDGTSFWQPGLRPGVVYRYRVEAVTRSGSSFNSAVLDISAGSGPADTAETSVASATNSQTTPARTSDLRFEITDSVVELEEGGAAVVIPYTVFSDPPASTARSISAQALDDWPGSATQVSLEAASIPAGVQRLDTQLRISLPIGTRPLPFHERRIRLSINDQAGAQMALTDLRYRVIPVRAADVYLLIGQSNMEGFSLDDAREAFPGGLDERSDRVRQLNVTSNNLSFYPGDDSFVAADFIAGSPRLIPAEDPLHELRHPFQSAKGGTHIGLGLSFAKAMLEQTTQEIILVPAAWSATGFCRNESVGNIGWNSGNTNDAAFAGGQLYRRALARLELALTESNGIFRGILWHQGEADSNNSVCASSYASNLDTLVRAVRTNAAVDRRGRSARGPDVNIPFIAGTMSRGNDERGSFSVFGAEKQRVDAAHRTIENRVAYTGVVNADDLVPPAYPCGNGSCVHFGAAAYREMGQRYAEILRQIWAR